MNAQSQALSGEPIKPVRPGKIREPSRWWTFVERRLPIIVIYLMVISLVGAILAPHVVVTVPSGHVGLMWKRFRGGTVLDPRQLKDEGLRVLLPWDKMFLYDLRLQTTTDTYNAITKDGVSINATISIRFRVKHDAVPQLHQAIGPDYVARFVRPEIGSRAREIIAEFTAEEVYSTKRQEVQRGIRGHTQRMLSEKTMERTAEQSEYGDAYKIPMDELINLLDTLVLGITLPPTVVNAINRKVEQYYLSEEYVFRVARERRESERKIIEAHGIAEFQRIVSQGISDSYLRWRGIEATLQLAQSPNSKIVVIGNSKDGMPIILGNADAVTPPHPPIPATEPGKINNERNTSAAPTISLERTRPHHLSPPVERFTSAGPEKPAEKPAAETPPGTSTTTTTTVTTTTNPPPAAETPPPAPAPTTGQRSSLIPRSLSDVEALFSRIVGSETATTERKPPDNSATTERQPPENPAPTQPQPPRR